MQSRSARHEKRSVGGGGNNLSCFTGLTPPLASTATEGRKIRHRFIKSSRASWLQPCFRRLRSSERVTPTRKVTGHDHGAEKTEGKEGGHGHEEESPSGASFKPGKGVMRSPRRRGRFGLQTAEVTEQKLPAKLRFNVQILARRIATNPRSRPRRVRRAWFRVIFHPPRLRDCPRGIARGSSNALKRRVSRRGARRASRTGHR